MVPACGLRVTVRYLSFPGAGTVCEIEDIYYFLDEYQLYFIECVKNIRIFTRAQHE